MSSRVKMVLGDGHLAVFRDALGVGRHRCRIEWHRALNGVIDFRLPGWDRPFVITDVQAVDAIVRVGRDGSVKLKRRRMALDRFDRWVTHENGKIDPVTHALVRVPATVARVPHFVLWVGPVPVGELRADYWPAGERRERP